MMQRRRRLASLAAVLLFGVASARAQTPGPDPELRPYKPSGGGPTGNLRIVGAAELDPFVAAWSGVFCRAYQKVVTELQGTDSCVTPAALADGSATFGAMDCPPSAAEEEIFRRVRGYAMTRLRVGSDLVAVYVAKDHPLAARGISLAELDAVFSRSRKAGASADITVWGQLGFTGDWAKRPIHPCGCPVASGVYEFFRQEVLRGGEFRETFSGQVRQADVVQAVATNPCAIGFASFRLQAAGVAAVPLLQKAGEPGVAAARANAAGYPLARPLWLCLDRTPGAPLDAVRREYLRIVYSRDGQQAVADAGYVPLTAAAAAAERARGGADTEGETKPAGKTAAAAPKSKSGKAGAGKALPPGEEPPEL